MKHLIFHLNILADPAMIRAHTQVGMARFLGERFGDEAAWFSAYSQILADWDSYHADLNFSGDEGMVDMREARFRIMRALFRIVGKPEPSQDEVHALADAALKIEFGSVFGHYSHPLVLELANEYAISLVSYFPQAQLTAMVQSAGLTEKIRHSIGADTFEAYEMNQRYFEMLLNYLKAKPEDCLYIDKQAPVLEAAQQAGLQIFRANSANYAWFDAFFEFLVEDF